MNQITPQFNFILTLKMKNLKGIESNILYSSMESYPNEGKAGCSLFGLCSLPPSLPSFPFHSSRGRLTDPALPPSSIVRGGLNNQSQRDAIEVA